MHKIDKGALPGILRSIKLRKPNMQPGDQDINVILEKIVAQQGGKLCIINGGKGISGVMHPGKEPEDEAPAEVAPEAQPEAVSGEAPAEWWSSLTLTQVQLEILQPRNKDTSLLSLCMDVN